MQQIEGISNVQVEQLLSEFAEEDLRYCLLVLILADHQKVFNAGYGGSAVEVEHVGAEFLAPDGRLIFEAEYFPFIFFHFSFLLINLVESFAYKSGSSAHESSHFSGAFHAEKIGFILNGDDSFPFRVGGVLFIRFVRLIFNHAVELCSEKVRYYSADDSLVAAVITLF